MDRHSCTIIIDTNQFRGDFMLSETRWERLLQYLAITNASLQMPTIIWEEIARNYRRHLETLFNDQKSTIEKINHHLDFNVPHFNYIGYYNKLTFSEPQLTPAEITDRYMAFLKASLGLETKDFIDWDAKWMSEVVARAINHVKPFSEDSDKGLKDTLIWKTILSLSSKHGFKDDPIVFISANTRDFCTRNTPRRIHPNLEKEACDLGLDIHYFENLDLFFENWASEVLSIDFRKIRASISDQLIKAGLKQYVRRYLPLTESPEANTFISAMSFKVISEVNHNRQIALSISGYISNSLIPTKYLDFSAEAIFKDVDKKQSIEVTSFDILDPNGPLYTALADITTAYKVE